MLKLERPELFKKALQMSSSNLKANFSQFDIVELALSLKLTNDIKDNNDKSADFIDILRGLEGLFNCQVGDPYKIINKIFYRKKSIMPFIDNLKTLLSEEDNRRLSK